MCMCKFSKLTREFFSVRTSDLFPHCYERSTYFPSSAEFSGGCLLSSDDKVLPSDELKISVGMIEAH
jgi:hypothetical protein